MQEVSIHELTFNKETQVLFTDLSDIGHMLDFTKLFSYESFNVKGVRETKRYTFNRTIRERSTRDTGDILYWVFIPTDRYGRRAGGPDLHIFND